MSAVSAASAQVPPAPPPPPAPALSEAECQVWARELGFARSVADHDADAFAEHVHPQAVFGAKGPQRTRGREAVVEQWAGLIAGTPVELQWYPTMVTVSGDSGVAYSSGPALYRSRDAQGEEKLALGGFVSVWTREADGAWRVLYDDGIRPVPADAAQAAAFTNDRSLACPGA
jgi:ketosteroid isomerase-like protein